MLPDDRIRLEHMRAAAVEAISFTMNRNRADLDSDRMLARALINATQEIGEAAVRITPALKAQLADIPWPAIIKMRNVLVHVYWGIDNDKLWDTVQRDLPALLAQLDRALNVGQATSDKRDTTPKA